VAIGVSDGREEGPLMGGPELVGRRPIGWWARHSRERRLICRWARHGSERHWLTDGPA
jgi:hypothetical protein